MKPQKRNYVVTVLVAFFLHMGIYAQMITTKSVPNEPGERTATATVKLMGIPLNAVTVSVVYGKDSLEVKNAFLPNKRNPSKYYETKASLRDLQNGTVEATMIFPHSGKEPLRREHAFPSGTKVYFAWARTHVPTNATEALTINSTVGSFKMPRPITIAYLGDSYASGEGAKGDGNWINEPCHRSNNSGGVLAIKKLIAERPEIEFDYVNTTCSGARVTDYFVTAQPVGPGSSSTKQDKQLDVVKRWMLRNHYNELDIMLADGGGNDISFGNLVEDGLLSVFRELRNDNNLKMELNRALNNLPDVYASFMMALSTSINPKKIVWMNYPNPLIGAGNRLCYQNFGNPLDCWGILENQLSNEDWVFINDNIFMKLNQKVGEAAAQHGWDLVDVSNKAKGYGICNCEGYFNTWGASRDSQGDNFGTFHPNARGFNNIYKQAVFAKLNANVDALIDDRRTLAIQRAKQRAKDKILSQKANN